MRTIERGGPARCGGFLTKQITVLLAVVTFLLAAGSTGVAHASGPTVATAFSGRTVDAATGHGVPFVLVIAYEEDHATPVAMTLTDLRGHYTLRGRFDEEIALRYVGRIPGYESGWQACDKQVVPSTGLSCTTSPRPQGQVMLDRRRTWW